MDNSALIAYQDKLTSGLIKPDPAQYSILLQLSRLMQHLKNQSRSNPLLKPLASLWSNRHPLKKSSVFTKQGIYLYGSVGSGKTMLMDLFVAHLNIKQKSRTHFFEFMQNIQRQLHQKREQGLEDKGDLIAQVCRKIAQKYQIICLDELEILDIGDAMIMSRIFAYFLKHRVYFVITSNRPPHDLYKDGLQRDRFQPFISLIEQNFEIYELKTPYDYRLNHQTNQNNYLTPADEKAYQFLTQLYTDKITPLTSHPREIIVNARPVMIQRQAAKTAFFEFDELCERPLGIADYHAISHEYKTVFIANIPNFGENNLEAARRFIMLIDTFYDRHIQLICSASSPAETLFPPPKRPLKVFFEFARTVSRLKEMQSFDYSNHDTLLL